MSDAAPKLDYAKPRPRPRWADVVLVLLAAIAALVLLFAPIAISWIFFSEAGQAFFERIYWVCLGILFAVLVATRFMFPALWTRRRF